YVSPYNNVEVVAGQGTVAVEMLNALPDLNTLVVAVGGGGLIAGIAIAAKVHNPEIRIIGVVAENAPVMKTCIELGAVDEVPQTDTIADGIAGNIDRDTITFDIASRLVDEWIAVPEKQIRSAVFDFLAEESMLIEGA